MSLARPVPSTSSAQPGTARIEPKADQILREMSGFLSSQRNLDVDTEIVTQAVTKQGEKLDFDATSHVTVERPNKVRADRRGDIADLSFFYDGKDVTLLGHRMNLFASAAAPPTLDAMVDFTRDRLGLDLPGADLLVSKPYPALIEDVASGKYLGTSSIGGKSCHHLAFRGKEVDWQLWVEEGGRPAPCKYVITTPGVTKAPEYSVEFKNWRFGSAPPPDTFAFVAPAGAKKIDFLDPNVRIGKE